MKPKIHSSLYMQECRFQFDTSWGNEMVNLEWNLSNFQIIDSLMERESGVTLNHGILTMLQRNWKNPRICYLLISYIRIRITIFNIS